MCEATGTELTYVRLAGDGTAAVLFLSTLVLDFVRCNNYARLTLLAGGITNLINAVIETFIPSQYGAIIVIIPDIGSMLLWPILILIAGFGITIMLEWCLFKRIMKKY